MPPAYALSGGIYFAQKPLATPILALYNKTCYRHFKQSKGKLMKITITRSTGTEHEWGVTCPPYDGKCQQCERPAGTWMKTKQGKWLCVKCDYQNKGQGK